jgi:hypothetical protein
MDEITINGEAYVPKKDLLTVNNAEGLPYCIIRCRDAGVHAGWLKERVIGKREVTLVNSRRLWRWWGKTLSGLATEGTFAPEKCKFADEIPEIILLDACEIIKCTEKAMESIRGVAPWTNS